MGLHMYRPINKTGTVEFMTTAKCPYTAHSNNLYSLRNTLIHFTHSCHKLEAEKGRHGGIFLENRICKFIDKQGMSLEIHFLLKSSVYAHEWKIYIPKEQKETGTYGSLNQLPFIVK